MGHALRGGGAEVELGAVGGGVCSARWLGHGTLPWWRRREGRRRSEGYPGAGVGARGTLGRREGASRGGGVSGAPRPALGAGAADRVRYGCKVDRSREEFGSGEILASHEDHVGSGNEGRAEHLEPAEMSRMARQAGAVIEGGRVLEQFARCRGGVQRLHLSAQPSKRVSPPATLSSREVTGASSKPNMRWRAYQAGAVRSSAGRWATLCAEEAPKSNWAPSGAASVARGGWATEHSRGGEGARGGAGARGTLERASERGVPWGAARVHHAEVASRARHARR